MEVDEEQLVELDLHVVDGLVAAGLERRQDGIREVLPRGDRLKQLGARLVHALRACDAVGLDFAGSGPCAGRARDRKSTRLNSSHTVISYAVFCLKKKK